jgi:hypothetical protein
MVLAKQIPEEWPRDRIDWQFNSLAWDIFVGFRSPSHFLESLLCLSFSDFSLEGLPFLVTQMLILSLRSQLNLENCIL